VILGLGIDVVEVARIRRLVGEGADPGTTRRFLERCFTEGERRFCDARHDPATPYAARFAAKEAASKALGTGLMTEIPWTDIEVLTGPSGEPGLHLHGRARAEADRQGLTEWALSLSHSGGHALAVVVATSR